MANPHFRILPLTIAISIALSGCLSSSDESSEEPVTLSGVVADGYLENAQVCLDLNLNKQCDSDEPQAITDSEGKYSFSADADKAGSFPVISVISENTRDADDPTRELQPYVMSAPAGKPEFISPMTTMIQTEIESNPGLSIEAAESSVKTTLGYSATSAVSLFKDYVAAKADDADADKAEYGRIHKIAQVTARTLEENHTLIKDAAAAAGRDSSEVMDELVRLVVKEVIANMQTITSAVDDATGEFDPNIAVSNTAIAVDTSTIEEDIAAEEAVSMAKSIDIAALLQTGLNWIESEFESKVTDSSYETSKITLDENNNIVSSEETWNGTDWVAQVEEDSESHNCQFLTGTGIVTLACDDNETIDDNGDGTATLSRKDDSGNVVAQDLIKGIEIPLAGERIRGTMEDEGWRMAIPGNAIFSEEAKGYRWSFTNVGDRYRIAYEEAETGETCADQGSTLTTANCISVTSNDAPVAAPDSLSELADGTSSYQFGRKLAVTLTQDETDATRGTVTYSLEGESIEAMRQGTYVIETPLDGTVEILSFNVPRKLREELDREEWAKLFFVAEEGYVRFGGMIADGLTKAEDDFTYNSSALTDIKNCFMGGDAAGSCPVEVKLRDGSLVADGEPVPVTFDASKSMVPFNLDIVGTTMELSTDGTEMRWSFIFNEDKTGSFIPASDNKARNMTWKITGNGRLKIEREFNSGSEEEIWIMTTMSDDTLHVRRKRSDGSKDFGGFMTTL